MRVLPGIVVALLAGACATLPAPQGLRVYEGRFSLTARGTAHQDSSSGRFVLVVRADGLTLDLSSPFGTTLARIESGPGGARLIVPGNAASARSDPGGLDQLTLNGFGWRLPVAGLADWIDGRPAPAHDPQQARLAAAPSTPSTPPGSAASAAQDASTSDRRTQFVQDGWTIKVIARFESGAPRQLTMDRDADGDDAPAMAVRLVLDHPPLITAASAGPSVAATRDQLGRQ